MSADPLKAFRDEVLKRLGAHNVVWFYHHGSRARGEPRSDSDYDTILVLRNVDEKVLRQLNYALLNHPQFQVFLLSSDDLEDFPPGKRLEFFGGKKLYGDLDLRLPSKQQVLHELRRSRLQSLHYLRHYLTLPHDKEKKAKMVYFQLKDAYFYLVGVVYALTGKIVSTRKQLISTLKEIPCDQALAKDVLQALDSYEDSKEKIAQNPDKYLFKLEKFFRTNRV